MKKKIILGLSLLGVAALSIVGGTFAFLTDAESDVSTYTTGNVDITLISKLENETIKLMPNNNDKKTADYQIKNTGDEAAYVWLRVIVPMQLDDFTDASNNIIHWNYLGAYASDSNKEEKYINSARAQGYEVPDGGVPDNQTWLVNDALDNPIFIDDYNVYDLLYAGELQAGETTTVGVSTIYLDNRVDKVGNEYCVVKNGVCEPIGFDLAQNASIEVQAHAIQAEGFENVQEAYAAYNAQWPNTKLDTTNQE